MNTHNRKENNSIKNISEKGDPTIEDIKRIVLKGKLEDAGFRIPIELRRYMDISSKGELIELEAIPESLKGLAEETRALWYKVHKKESL